MRISRKNSLIGAGIAAMAAVTTLAVAPQAQAADEYCRVVSDGYQYANVTSTGTGAGYQVTLHPGHIYHALTAVSINYRVWFFGHDDEYPNLNGWVLAGHTSCP